MPVVDTAALVENRVEAIRLYHRRCGIERAEIDVSGGVDSAVLLSLLVRALGADQVTAVFIGIHSGQEFRERAKESALQCRVPLIDFDATQVFDVLHASMLEALEAAGYDMQNIQKRMETDRAVKGSIRSCLRAPIGRGFNRLTGGGVRHGTGNECEDRFLRFYQKGGDGEVDTNPIAMLSKGEVFQLARALEVPRPTRAALPSPDLHGIGEAHNDEDELRELYGVHWTYSRVDPDTGDYSYLGNIERMSRFLDQYRELFGPGDPDWKTLTGVAYSGLFRHLDSQDTVRAMLDSARSIERQTRHKHNPACPTLGSRAELIEQRLLEDRFSDELIEGR